MTSAYTELGARSYSVRVLDVAKRISPAAAAQYFDPELVRLKEELHDSENQKRDSLWEEFFSSGSNIDQLYKLTEAYPLMQRRIDLIEGQFRFNSEFKVEEEEIFWILCGDKSTNTFTLG